MVGPSWWFFTSYSGTLTKFVIAQHPWAKNNSLRSSPLPVLCQMKLILRRGQDLLFMDLTREIWESFWYYGWSHVWLQTSKAQSSGKNAEDRSLTASFNVLNVLCFLDILTNLSHCVEWPTAEWVIHCCSFLSILDIIGINERENKQHSISGNYYPIQNLFFKLCLKTWKEAAVCLLS